ncbi:hypothetical protein B0H11DRAFT_1904132 [Mycena galericulata]|nr:hypothetical protein B0H11DRAFT_1904132 [Mycena galericulata]
MRRSGRVRVCELPTPSVLALASGILPTGLLSPNGGTIIDCPREGSFILFIPGSIIQFIFFALSRDISGPRLIAHVRLALSRWWIFLSPYHGNGDSRRSFACTHEVHFGIETRSTSVFEHSTLTAGNVCQQGLSLFALILSPIILHNRWWYIRAEFLYPRRAPRKLSMPGKAPGMLCLMRASGFRQIFPAHRSQRGGSRTRGSQKTDSQGRKRMGQTTLEWSERIAHVLSSFQYACATEPRPHARSQKIGYKRDLILRAAYTKSKSGVIVWPGSYACAGNPDKTNPRVVEFQGGEESLGRSRAHFPPDSKLLPESGIYNQREARESSTYARGGVHLSGWLPAEPEKPTVALERIGHCQRTLRYSPLDLGDACVEFSLANVLGKAVKYIRVLKNPEAYLTRDFAALKTLLRGICRRMQVAARANGPGSWRMSRDEDGVGQRFRRIREALPRSYRPPHTAVHV